MVLIEHRVTDTKENLQAVVNWMKGECVLHLACFELSKAGSPHMHAVIDVKNISTYRQHFIKKFINYKGNQCYKISNVDDYEKKIRYICKGNEMFKPEVLHNGKEINIEENYKTFWEKNKELKANNISNSSLKDKKPRPNFLQDCKSYIERKYPKYIPQYNKNDLQFLTCIVCEKLGQAGKLLDGTILKRMVLGLLNMMNPNSKLLPSLFAQIFPDFADDKFCYNEI